MNTPLSAHVLVVDDDPALRELLASYLGGNGFTVDTAADGVQMQARLAERMPDVLVLDLMLPGADGLTLARELRRTSNLPILMLSARGEEIDRVVGLEVGADDYLAKPFSPRELLARLRALVRRSHISVSTLAPSPSMVPAASAPGPAAAAPALQRFGPYTLDSASWRLLKGHDEVPLGAAEFELLRLFVARPHQVLSRDDLITQLKGYERDAFDRSIDVRVTRLRRKIEPDPAHPIYVRTVRGQGYLFNPAGEATV